MSLLLKSLKRIDVLVPIAPAVEETARIDEATLSAVDTMTESPVAVLEPPPAMEEVAEAPAEQVFELERRDETVLEESSAIAESAALANIEPVAEAMPFKAAEEPAVESWQPEAASEATPPIESSSAEEAKIDSPTISDSPRTSDLPTIEPAPAAELDTSPEASLARLSELHALIDAALSEFQPEQPIIAEPAEADTIISTLAPQETAEAEEQIVAIEPEIASIEIAVPQAVMPPEVVPLRIFNAPPLVHAAPSLRIRDEYRELRDHLLARFSMDTPCTLMVIDAGRAVGDAAWLAPFAASLSQHLSEHPTLRRGETPRILLVEAAGPECGIARHLGLECEDGLSDLLHSDDGWNIAVQPTSHPQVDLLSGGNALFQVDQSEQLKNLWSELQYRYHVLLVAAGPWIGPKPQGAETGFHPSSFLELADAAILSVELDGTPEPVAVETKRALDRHNVRLLGCIVAGEPTAAD